MEAFDSLDHVLANAQPAEADRILTDLHTEMHDRPLDHLRVHMAWMRLEAGRGRYLRAGFHAFAGFVFAVPASLVQRYTGLVVPAFDSRGSGRRGGERSDSGPSRA